MILAYFAGVADMEDVDAYFKKGIERRVFGEFEEAIKELDQSLEIDLPN